MSNLNFKKHRSRRRKSKTLLYSVAIASFLLVGSGGIFLYQMGDEAPTTPITSHHEETTAPITEEMESSTENSIVIETTPVETELNMLLDQAQALITQYDYDGAITLLSEHATLKDAPEVIEVLGKYETEKSTLVAANLNEVSHVFFHSLIVDTDKSFDGDYDSAGYNQVMTTADEFMAILQAMYDNGYVLVKMSDLGYVTTDENGNTIMAPGTILLPEGKKPFVMSQDDVNYYDYMTGDGFADRIVLDENGEIACEMTQSDGSVSVGSYDLPPLLNDFVEMNPGFSYKGAKAVLAVTGYEGVFGYRTADSYSDSATYEQDKESVRIIAEALREDGFEIASHSWGHLYLGQVEMNRFTTDLEKWEREVETLVGETNIILYPFGDDISTWKPYTSENERFVQLRNAGFHYFCNVDASVPYWLQYGKDYIRQGRINLDGYRLWKDMTNPDPSKRKLDDFFRPEDIFDPARPTPVMDM